MWQLRQDIHVRLGRPQRSFAADATKQLNYEQKSSKRHKEMSHLKFLPRWNVVRTTNRADKSQAQIFASKAWFKKTYAHTHTHTCAQFINICVWNCRVYVIFAWATIHTGDDLEPLSTTLVRFACFFSTSILRPSPSLSFCFISASRADRMFDMWISCSICFPIHKAI